MEFLDFEVPIKEILDQIDKCKSIENESDVDITKTYNLLQKKLVETKKDIYGNLSLKDIEKTLIDYAKDYDVEIYFKQSNHEGELIELVQEASKKARLGL